MNRRGFLSVAARMPIVTAISGRALAEKAAADLSGIVGAAGGSLQGRARQHHAVVRTIRFSQHCGALHSGRKSKV